MLQEIALSRESALEGRFQKLADRTPGRAAAPGDGTAAAPYLGGPSVGGPIVSVIIFIC